MARSLSRQPSTSFATRKPRQRRSPSRAWNQILEVLESRTLLTTVYVNSANFGVGTGASPATGYHTIGDAIGVASANETIKVETGFNYSEHVVIPSGLTGLTIEADTNQTPLIFDGGSGAGITINASGVTIQGLTVAGFLTGIDVNSTGAAITGDSIGGNTTGIQFESGATGSVDGNAFTFGGGTPSTNTTDLAVLSGAGMVTVGATTANAFESTTTYIDNQSLQNITATNNSYGGLTPSVGGLADDYTIQNEIKDAVWYGSSSGLVRIVAGDVYVTQANETHLSGSIQRGIDAASSGNTVDVQAGTYVANSTGNPGGLDVTKPLTLLGAQATVDARTRSGAETTILPGASDPDPFDATSVVVVLVESSNVTIDGFTVDGDNPALSSGVVFNGADIDAAIGIASFTGVSDITIQNNIVKNTAYDGIDFENDNIPGATDGNIITQNLIENLSSFYGFGIGVVLQDDFYASVTDNTISDVNVGVQTGNFTMADPGDPATTAQISNNAISTYGVGIFYNLMYDSTSTFTVQANNITAVNDPAGGDADWTGFLITSIQSSVSVLFTGNMIDGSAATSYSTVEGYTVWNTPTTGSLEISGGTVSGVDTGVWVNNFEGYDSDAVAATQVTINDVSITASQIGVYVQDDPQSGTDPSVTATIEGDTSISGAGAIGIEVSGAAATISLSGTLPATLDGGLSKYIVLANGALGGPVTLDASQVSFNGFVGATGTVPADLATYFGIEDKITDYLDDPTLGYVSLKSGDVFVAQSSESPNAGSIQRGIDAASDYDTVNVQAGTYVASGSYPDVAAGVVDEIDIDKPLTLLGPVPTLDPNSPPPSSDQAIIEPGASDPNPSDSTAITVIGVNSSNVTIQGITIDGSNDVTPGFVHYVDPNSNTEVIFDGVAIDASEGISSYVDVGSITIENNIIEHTAYDGVDFENSPNYSGAATTDNAISDNLVENLSGFYGFGVGVTLYNNFYASVTDNVITNVNVGVQTGNFSQADPGDPTTTAQISDNAISTYGVGIFYNLMYESTSTFTIGYNDITAVDDPAGTSPDWTAFLITSIQDAVSASFIGNTVDGSNTAGYTTVEGYTVWNTPTTGSLEISGGTVSGVDTGVWVNNFEGYDSDAGAATQVTINDVSITASQIGVYVQDDPQSGTDPSVSATIEGDTSISGAGAIGIEVSGAAATITLSGTLPATLDGGLSNYIVLANGALGGPVTLDASQVSFDGFVGADGTVPADLATYFGIEDKITDYLDDPTLGYVSLKSGDVFVAQSSESPNAGSIQRGIDAASSGNTVYVQAGAYTADVTINKTLTLLGAQAGVSAPTRSGPESVVNANAGGDTIFSVAANDVTINGFTVQGQTNANVFGPGIYLEPGTHGSQVLDNIVQNNVIGLDVANNSPTDQTVVDGNLFQNNTQPGSSSGTDIYADQYTAGSNFQNVLIENNTFTNTSFVEDSWGIGISNSGTTPFSAISVENNTFSNAGRGMYFYNTDNATVTGNTISGATHYSIGLFGSNGTPANALFSISGNTMNDGANPGVGILLSDDSPPGYAYSGTLTLTGNTFNVSGGSIVNESATPVDATSGNTFNGLSPSLAGLSDDYTIQNTITDGTNVEGYGLVRIVAGNVYITQLNEANYPGSVLNNVPDSIQRGIDAATANDIVNVQGGATEYVANSTEIPGELYIGMPLTLSGAEVGVDPRTGRAGPESTIVPGVSGPDPNASDQGIIYVGSSNVTIDGFTVDGDNPALTSGVVLNGADIDAAEGIVSYTGVGNITVQNNIIKNMTYDGIDFYNYSNGAAATDNNTITQNLIENLGGGGYGFGVGVLLYNNFYANVTENKIEDVNVGVQTGNFSNADPGDPGTTANISNNDISTYGVGVFYNLMYDASSPFTVQANNITAVNDTTDGSADWAGFLITSIQSSVSVLFTGNTIDGSAATSYSTVEGYTVWNTPTTGSLEISGGTVSGVDTGVWVNNFEGYDSDAGAATQVTINDVSITASQIGVYVQDDPQSGTDPSVTATIEGDTSISGAGAIGIEVSGAAATITLSGTLPATLDGGLSQYIVLANGALGGPVTLDASQVSFDGFVGADGTVPADLATYFGIEDKITDYLDDPTLGYVSLKSDPVFVAQSSEMANTGAIQRGVNVASSGDSVYVQGGAVAYAGDVTIPISLSLLGANAGVNAVTGSRVAESVIDGTDFGVWVEADHVTIDGFTVQNVAGGDNAGIYLPGTISGYQVLNNIVQNNVIGLYANSSGAYPSLIQYNLIQNNTNGGAAQDSGIYADQSSENLTVDSNKFVDNDITFGWTDTTINTGITISNNQVVGGVDAGEITLLGLTNSSVTGNTISGSPYTALATAGGNNGLTISGNTIENAQGGIYLAGDVYSVGLGPDLNIAINDNTINNDVTGVTIASGCSATMLGNTVENNTDTGGDGGGIYNDGTLTVTNSTIANNSAALGGGIYNTGTLTVYDSTIAYNTTSGGAGSGGGVDAVSGSATLYNTIVALNTDGSGADDIAGTITGSYNLIGTGGSGGLTNTSGNQVGVASGNVGLAPAPAENGGPTETIALLAGSYAIDKGSNALIPAGVMTDQRGPGYPRIVNGIVDIGAFEASGVVTPATGGTTISADTSAPGLTFTTLTGPLYDGTSIPLGTIVLNAPAGFDFNTDPSNLPSVLITHVSGSGPDAVGTITSVTSTQITFTVTTAAGAGTEDSLTWQNVEVQPSAGTPLASGNIYESGSASLVGVTQGPGGTNFGTLTEVPGAASQLVIHTQPSATATAGMVFATQPVIYEEDQFGNVETADNSTVVTVALHTGSGPLLGTLTATVSGGIATFTNLQDNTAETITLNFTSSGLTTATSNNIVVSPTTATQLVIHTQPSSTATAGVAFGTQPVIYEEDQYGNLETGDNTTVVTVALNTGTGPLLGTLTATVSGGIATFTNLKDNTAETITLNFTSSGLTTATSNNIVVSPTTASQLVIHTQPSSTATAGVAFAAQPVIYEEDQYGNLETADNTTVVTAALNTGSGPLQGTLTATVSGGIATFTNLSDNKAETITLKFTSGVLASATSTNIVVSPTTASQLVIHTQPSPTATAGVAFGTQPVIYEEDQYGNLETADNSTVVTAALNTGTGPLLGTLTATVSGGIATFTNLSDNKAETISLKFTSSGLTTATSNNIVVSPTTASQLVIHTQPSSTATAGVAFATQPVIYEEDQYGNLETGDNSTVVTAALNTGSGPLQGTLTATVSGGIATFTNLSDNKAETISLKFTSPGLTTAISNSIVVNPTTATKLVIHTQPSPTATAGVAFATQPVIYEEDQYGNLETGDNSTVVTAALNTGSGPLQGTLTATVSGGIATFTNLSDNKAETISLKFTSGVLASATSNNIVVFPTTASQLVIHTQPSPTATAGVAFATQPVIYEEDQYGNLETGDNTTVVTAALNTGSGPLQGTLTATVSGGIATFTNLADNTAETITLKFTSPGLTTAISNSIVVSSSNTSFTIFGNTIPANPSQNDSSAVDVGVKFDSSQSGYITGVRFYKGSGNTGTHIGYLWTSTGTLLASATFTGETGTGWQQVTFATPVAITAGTIYVASYYAPAGHYADTNNYFASAGHTNGPLTALANSTPGGNGVYVYGAAGHFPTSTYLSSNYWVDVLFSTTQSTATQLVVHTQPSSTATAGVAFGIQPVIYEEDQFGNLETGDNTTVVTVALNSGSGPLQGTLTATVSGGIATFTNLSDNKAETITLNFTSPGLTTATSTSIVVSPTTASQLVIHTQPSPTATAGVAFAAQPVIYEEDQYGNLETADNSTVVTAALNSGSGPLQGTLTATVSGGIATFTNLSDNKAETISLKFTSPGLTTATSANIVVSPTTASQLVIHTQPSSTATAGVAFAAQPVIYEEDQYGNLETADNSTVVTAALNTGSGPLQGTLTATVSGGIATFTNLSDNKAETISLKFTSSGLTTATSNNIVVSPTTASQLVIHTQPSPTATAGVAFATQPVIYEEDQYGNLETGNNTTVVTVALNSGSGPLLGTLTATVSGGIATFTNLSDNKAETISLKFTSSGLTTATSNNIVVSPTTASQLVIHTQPSSTATAGVAFATQPVIYEEDQYGNLETGDNSTVVTAALNTGSGPLQGTLTATVSGGIATFTNLSDNKAETISLKFTSSGLTTATSNNIVVSPTTASQLVIHTQPSPTATAGVAFATQPVIYEEDQYGNLETADNSTVVTVALNTGSGPLQGTLTATVSGGVATFVNLSDNTAETITLKFTSGVLASAISNSIVVSPATTGATIFGNTIPANPSQNDSSAVELGVKFESSVAGYITGIRFYKASGNTGTHIGYLWTSTGTLLASATFTGETASGWQQVSFATPVAITSGTIYVASYYAPAGHYADTNNFFASSGYTNGSLTALANSTPGGNGVYVYGAAGHFPTSTYLSSNYWVDVLFSTSAPMMMMSAIQGNSMGGAGGAVLGTTSEASGTAALDAALAGWTSSDSPSRVAQIMNSVRPEVIASFDSGVIAQDTNADTLSIGSSQLLNDNPFITLTSPAADTAKKKSS